MQRDMDLVRKILLSIQARRSLKPTPVQIDGIDDEVVTRHAQMLYQAGFLEASEFKGINDLVILVRDLSWDGHEFLSALESKGVWSRIKEKYGPAELASLPFAVMKEVAFKLATELALSQAGLK